MVKSFNDTSRRDFLKGAIYIGSTTMMSGGIAYGANETINVAVIGCGVMGGNHIRNFSKLPNVKLIAVSDPDTSRMDAKTVNLPYSVAKYQDFRHVLDDKTIDAVVIATPNHWHALMAVMAMQAGKHVYVQKPVSHSIWEGRQMVNAARKYNKIVQAGTQHRSCPGVIEAAKDIQAGVYGDVKWVHCSKLESRNPIGKATGPFKIPSHIDYNLWAGPTEMSPVMRKSLHYNWHWQWQCGDGEMGNWGIHYVDDVRHLLGWQDVPESVIAAGNRYAWNDDGETPNMHIAMFEQQGVKVVVDIRNLQDLARPVGSKKRPGGKSGAIFHKSRGGNHIQMSDGFIRISRGGGWAYDLNGKKVKQYKGNGGRVHEQNFIDAIGSGKSSDLNCEIGIGHQSTVMCHQANIAYRVGQKHSIEQAIAAMKDHEDAVATLSDMQEQITGVGVDLSKSQMILGPKLTFSNNKEQFVGANSEGANAYLKNKYRAPFFMHEISQARVKY